MATFGSRQAAETGYVSGMICSSRLALRPRLVLLRLWRAPRPSRKNPRRCNWRGRRRRATDIRHITSRQRKVQPNRQRPKRPKPQKRSARPIKSEASDDTARQADADRELRRLGRISRPGRQGKDLLCARPAAEARAQQAQTRSGLCVHFEPAWRKYPQRSLDHHGLSDEGRRRCARPMSPERVSISSRKGTMPGSRTRHRRPNSSPR